MTVRVELDPVAIAALLVGEEIRDDLERRVKRVERRAKGLVDVETGRLRDSIGSEVRREGLGLVGVVGSDLEYSLVEEIRDPYLRPAVQAAK